MARRKAPRIPNALLDQLYEIVRTAAKGAHAVLPLDRAGWHRMTSSPCRKNISPIFRPSRSPEVNPVKNS